MSSRHLIRAVHLRRGAEGSAVRAILSGKKMRAPATVNDVTRGPENATRAALRVISGCRTGHNE